MRHLRPGVAAIVAAMLAALTSDGGAAFFRGRQAQAPEAPAATAFERLKALEGDWIDPNGDFGTKGAVAVRYHVVGNGTAVVETFPLGTAWEMVTIYTREGQDIVLTHYCTSGNQPRMRARSVAGNRLTFEFDGGANVDPARDSHMHSMWMEFVSDDELRSEWQNWTAGKPAKPGPFRVVRKKP
jgi:hypothetical protein